MPATIHDTTEVTPQCNPSSFSTQTALPPCTFGPSSSLGKYNCSFSTELPLPPYTSEQSSTHGSSLPSLDDEVSCEQSAGSFRLSIGSRSATFSDCVEVREFSPEPDESPMAITSGTCSPVENVYEDEQQEQQEIITPFRESIERRKIQKSVTVNIGLRSCSMVNLKMHQSGLWRRRKLFNDSTMVYGKSYSVPCLI